MKQKLWLFAFTLISSMLLSQAVPTVFEDWKTNSGTQNFFYKNVTKTDSYGNIYVAGATINGSGNTDMLIAKYNSSGVQLWIQQFAGTANGVDFFAGLAVTDSYVYVAGAVSNNTLVPETDAITMKLAASTGSVVWSTTYTGAAGGHDGLKHIVLDASGDVFVTGGTYNTNFNTDFLTIKYDGTTGSQSWVSTYAYSFGGDDLAIKITTSGSNLTVTGGVTSASNTYNNATLTYAKATGSLTASSISTITTTSSITAVTDLAADGSGNIFVIGSISVPGQGENIYVHKLSNTLVTAWTYTYNGGSNLDDIAKGVVVDASGNVYITGYSKSSTTGKNEILIKLNSSGTNQWTQTSSFSGDDEATDLVIDASSNLYLTGSKTTGTNSNYYTAKFNSSGTKQWEIEADGNHLNDNATNICLDSLNNIIVTGQTETASNTYNFTTVKYVQYDVFPFTDINSEAINPQSIYIPNKGQLLNTSLNNETDILFYNLNNYPETYIAKNRMSFLLFHRDTLVSTTDSTERIDLKFNNCKTSANVYTESSGTTNNYNFFVGSTTVRDIHGYTKIISPEIYSGIDLHYYSNAYGAKAYFVVKPYADPRQIEILLQGQQSATVTSNNLKITGLLGSFNLRNPNVYNSVGGTNTAATGTVGWALSGSTVSINTGTYNTSQPLVIEFSNTSDNTFASLSSAGPSDNLDWCTYVGNTVNDKFIRIAIDKSNNKYMAGSSDGNNYPTTTGVFSGSYVGGTAIVITKFNPLNQLLHSTYYGGSTTSSSGNSVLNDLRGIAVDSLQNIFFVGRTNASNFPFPLAANQPSGSYYYTTNPTNATNSGSFYITSFVVKLDSSMATNLWGTHIGNTYISCLNDVMVDKNQNVTVVGYNRQSGATFNFPTPTTGAYYNTLGEGLLFRFSNNGIAQYATRTANWIFRIAENKANGDYFIATKLNTGDVGQKFKNPGGVAYYDSTVYLNDFYLARFNNQDSITWATVFGGIHQESVVDMALRDSTLILVGTSDGIGFPIKYAPGQYVDSVHTNTAAYDIDLAFVRFNSYTGKWIYSSYYGGDELTTSGGIQRDDYGLACTIDNNGRYYISGNTSSDPASNFILQQASGFYYNGTYYGNNSGFLLAYTANNDKILSTYLGGRPYTNSLGSDDTYMNDMDVSPSGELYIAGSTNANRYFPIYDASAGVAYMDTVLFNPTNIANTDAFVVMFNDLSFVGIHDLDKNNVFNGVLVYPNPSMGIYTVEINGVLTNKNIIFNVYNVMGQMVYKDETKTHDSYISKQINLNNLSQGVYFINIIQDNKSLTTKVIKQ